jgi:hypothetical protein
MGGGTVATVLLVMLVASTSGCCTKLAVSFGNGTPMRIRVRSSESGEEVIVAPGRFKQLANSVGDLIVTTQGGRAFAFRRVAPFETGPGYVATRSSVFGVGCVTLRVKLETNMSQYVLPPCKKSLDTHIPQPNGYPKHGEKMAD